MEVDIGSFKRRRQALERVDTGATDSLDKAHLIDSLAECDFDEFRDARLAREAALPSLLAAVQSEHRAGRLIFGDLGALFWLLLKRFPSVDAAYRERYPVVIADEHQDASALQDAVVRHLGRRLVVFADPMQLIHEFLGASAERLDRHRATCEQELSLNTPHRWHMEEANTKWLLAVRARLQGADKAAPAPAGFSIRRTAAEHGLNAVKLAVQYAIRDAFQAKARRIAVLARTNDECNQLRDYLCREGLHPRQIGGEDFEEARADIEGLAALPGPQEVALRALERVRSHVPTLSEAVVKQVRGRLGTDGVNLSRAGKDAADLLRSFELLYARGVGSYFNAVDDALERCAAGGHHLPRAEALWAIRATASELPAEPLDLNDVLAAYSERVVTATHAAPRGRGGLFVMTTHQAKGKEFDAVVLSNFSARLYPDKPEVRRLAYVAITRASRRWTIIAPTAAESPLLGAITGYG